MGYRKMSSYPTWWCAGTKMHTCPCSSYQRIYITIGWVSITRREGRCDKAIVEVQRELVQVCLGCYHLTGVAISYLLSVCLCPAEKMKTKTRLSPRNSRSQLWA